MINIHNKTQLSNYLTQLRQIKYGSIKISLGEIHSWCQQHSLIPDSDDLVASKVMRIQFNNIIASQLKLKMR